MVRMMTGNTDRDVHVTILHVWSKEIGKKRNRVKSALTWAKRKVVQNVRKGDNPKSDDSPVDEDVAKREETVPKSESQARLTIDKNIETAETESYVEREQSEATEAEKDDDDDDEEGEGDDDDDDEEEKRKQKDESESEDKQSKMVSGTSISGKKIASRRRKIGETRETNDLLLLEALKNNNVHLVEAENQYAVEAMDEELKENNYDLIICGIGTRLGNNDVVDYLLEEHPSEFMLFIRQTKEDSREAINED